LVASALFFPSPIPEEWWCFLQLGEKITPQPMDLAGEGRLEYEMNPPTYSSGGLFEFNRS